MKILLMQKAKCWALIICLLSLSPILAQQLVERTVCVFDFAPLGLTEPNYSRLCGDTVSIELEVLGYKLIANSLVRQTYTNSLSDEKAMVQAARELGADVAVIGFYVIDSTGIHIGIKAIDILTGLPAVAVSESGTAGFEVFDTIDNVAALVASRIRQALKPLPASEIIVHREEITVETTIVEEVVSLGTPITITIISRDEGARIMAGDALLGTVENGQALIQTVDGIKLDLIIQKARYFQNYYTIFTADTSRIKAAPKLIRNAQHEILAQAVVQKPFGLDITYSYLLLNGIFGLGAGTGIFYLPLEYPASSNPYLTDNSELFQATYGSAYLNLPVSLALGFYPMSIFWPKSWYRPGLKAGLLFDSFFIGSRQPAFSLSGLVSGSTAIMLNQLAFNFEISITRPISGMQTMISYSGAQTGILLKMGVGYRW